jgi:hypothetical protein
MQRVVEMNYLFSNSSRSLVKINGVPVYLVGLHKDFFHANPFTESGDSLHEQFADPPSLVGTQYGKVINVNQG